MINVPFLCFLADFGDFTQFMSQDFLREYVLFPVVSPQIFTVQILACLCVAWRHTFLCYLCTSSLCIPEWQAENSLKTQCQSYIMDWDKALGAAQCIDFMKYHVTLGKLPATSTTFPIPYLLLCSQNWQTGDEVLEEWTKKVAEEHKSHWYCQLRVDVRTKKKCEGNDLLSAWNSFCLCFPVECRLLKQSCCTSRRWRNWMALAKRAFLLR